MYFNNIFIANMCTCAFLTTKVITNPVEWSIVSEVYFLEKDLDSFIFRVARYCGVVNHFRLAVLVGYKPYATF